MTDKERIAVLENQVQELLKETKSLRSSLIEVASIVDKNFRAVTQSMGSSKSSWLENVLGF